jgi:hypothetical protein
MRNRNLMTLVARLAAQEQAWHGRTFLAPVQAGGRARVQLEGLRYEVAIDPAGFTGCGVFRMVSPQLARWDREPTLKELDDYFRRWPRKAVRLALQTPEGPWLGFSRESVGAAVVVAGVSSGSPFEAVETAFDGRVAWYRGPILTTSPRLAEQLYQALEQQVAPEKLRLKGLTPGERQAYTWSYFRRYGLPEAAAVAETTVDRDQRQLQRALHKAGARLRSYRVDEGQYLVHWVDSQGRDHHSAISRSDLTVISSGICLSGRDQDFDLTSLVGVVEEG